MALFKFQYCKLVALYLFTFVTHVLLKFLAWPVEFGGNDKGRMPAKIVLSQCDVKKKIEGSLKSIENLAFLFTF